MLRELLGRWRTDCSVDEVHGGAEWLCVEYFPGLRRAAILLRGGFVLVTVAIPQALPAADAEISWSHVGNFLVLELVTEFDLASAGREGAGAGK